jgi:hypothetical protein
MSADPGPAVKPAEVVEAIRAESAAIRITPLGSLQERFPEADIPALIDESAAGDIESVVGSGTRYYFSTISMTRAYATHLARIADRDPLRLVAETVREESRIYPRPTPIIAFCDPPFRITSGDLPSILEGLTATEEFSDIRSCRASNGAVYLYSTRHLTPDHAEGLTEWNEVGRRDNP